MIKQISTIGLLILLASSCEYKKPYTIKLTNSFSNYSELLKEYNDIFLDSVGLYGEPKEAIVLEVEVTNNSVDSLCFHTLPRSNYFIYITMIQSKYPIEKNPLNWSFSILDNWGKFGKSCIGANNSKIYLFSYDTLDLSQDSLIITFSSPTLRKGVKWELPYLRSKN